MSERSTNLPPEQQAIRAKCFHPSGTFVGFPKEEIEQSIPARFEKIVRLYPDRLAVKTIEHQVTYESLNRLANELAHEIIARQGSNPEPVALFLDRWDTLIVGHLGVLKTGKFSLAVDPAAEVNRTAHLISDSGVRVMIVDQNTANLARRLVVGECSVINLSELNGDLPEDNPRLQIPSDACAYIRYTSGSTGSAKGAIKTHRHVLKAVMDFTNSFHLCPEDRVALLGFASIGKHLFEALLTGACFCPYDARKEGLVELAEWLRRENATVFYSFPTALRYFLNGLSDSAILPDLRLIELEGEPVFRTDFELLKRHVSSDCVLVNTLSSAETGTVSLYFLDMKMTVDGERVPVGYPVEGMEILILDDSGQVLDVDEGGEVAVRSNFLSDGYWRKPDVTSQKFISQSDNGSRFMYYTGDLGRLARDGCLHLLGRKDFQVKIRSFRVDVTEVESALMEHGEIQIAAVIGKNDQTGNTRLVAYVVPRNTPGPTIASLKKYLQDKLPEYMIPAEVVFLVELPLMSTGKIDRRALANPTPWSPGPNKHVVTPQTPIEKKLADLWAEVLSLSEIGIHDNFFDLGGHSLAASLIVSRVIQRFKLELPIKALFDSPTVAEMAAVITECQERKLGDDEVERILEELESMSDEEAQHLAAKETVS
jgi:amino acid adenylation domain-containing protein